MNIFGGDHMAMKMPLSAASHAKPSIGKAILCMGGK